VTTGTDRSSSVPARAATSLPGRWTAPGTCPWSQASRLRLSSSTKPGAPDSSAACTSLTSVSTASRRAKCAAAAAGSVVQSLVTTPIVRPVAVPA
jgi:hypothetical protein